jgi:hypothetical protein
MLLELLHKDEAEIAKVGVKAIEQAHAAGVAAYYIDESPGDGIVKEMLDGTRQLVDDAGVHREVHDTRAAPTAPAAGRLYVQAFD